MNRGAEANEPEDTILAIEICAAVEAVVATVVSEHIARRPIPGPPNRQAEVCSSLWRIGQNRELRDFERIGLEIIGMIGYAGQCSSREELAKKISEFDQELRTEEAQAEFQMLRICPLILSPLRFSLLIINPLRFSLLRFRPLGFSPRRIILMRISSLRISPLYEKAKQSWQECDEAALALRVALINTLLINDDTTSLVELRKEAQSCKIIPPDICKRLIDIESHERRAAHLRAPLKPISDFRNYAKEVNKDLLATLQRWSAYVDVTKEEETVERIFHEWRIQNQDEVVERGEQNPHLIAIADGRSNSIPQIAMTTTRNGQVVCQASCSTAKAFLNADATLNSELAQVQNQAHRILEEFAHDSGIISEFQDIIQASIQNGGVAPPENFNLRWPQALEDFIEALERACEIQVNNSADRLRELIFKLADDVKAVIGCVEIIMKFTSKQARFEFLKDLLKEDLSRKLAEAIFDEKFRSLLSTPNESWLAEEQSRPDEKRTAILQKFLEQIADMMSVRIEFSVDQLMAQPRTPSFPLAFNISAAKLLLPHHDTLITDKKAMTDRLMNNLQEDADLLNLIKPLLTEGSSERLSNETE